MYYVGVDLHKEQSWFYVMSSTGKRISSMSISNEISVLKQYFNTIPRPFKLAVESTYNWYYFVDLAEQFAKEVFLANSYELKAFAKRNKKTDKIDARLIADVLRKGYLPTVYISDKQTRSIKEVLRYRMNLVKDRAKVIHRLKSLLDRLGLLVRDDFTTDKALDSLDLTVIPEQYHGVICKYIEQLKWYRVKLYAYRDELKNIVSLDQDMLNLITIPGIGHFSAALIKTEIADISRFKSFNRLCAYAGLAPRVSQSANITRHGPLNKNRCKNLQWILVENVIHFAKALPAAKRKLERVKQRKGYNTAKVACAREMLKIVYHVLKEQRPFYSGHVGEFDRTHAVPALQGV